MLAKYFPERILEEISHFSKIERFTMFHTSPPNVLRAKDAAKYLGVSISTFYRIVNTSSLKDEKVFISKRAVGWTIDALDSYIASQKVGQRGAV